MLRPARCASLGIKNLGAKGAIKMTTSNMKKASRSSRIGLAIALMFFGAIAFKVSAAPQNDPDWKIPEEAKKVKNPEKPTPETLKEAKTLFENNCAPCHGDTGEGDGPVSDELLVKPANLTDAKSMNPQTDGELFYRITTGFSGMPSWSKFSDTQRWRLVNFIRTLANDKKK
jgi:mono/diheme cytochrome c family protein